MSVFVLNEKTARDALPKRPENGNKGTFGRVLLLTGSPAYRGAACLSVEAALRSGVGYVHFAAEKEVADAVLSRFPEVLFHTIQSDAAPSAVCELADGMDATLFGCGCGNTEKTEKIARVLLTVPGTPLILDADALNALAATDHLALWREAKRKVLITPHPGEFSRLSGLSVAEIEKNREKAAVDFAQKTGCVVLLKGKNTVVTDGKTVMRNETGDTSLAKAGSGDVLAGWIAGLCASGADLLTAASLGAFFHGKAGETLGARYSPYGVTASDLPIAIAEEVRKSMTL